MTIENKAKNNNVTLRRVAVPALLLAAASTLGACDKLGLGGDKAPTGQVVATLDGDEITMLEVNAELAGTPIPPSVKRRDAEKMALENIITRRTLAKLAEEQEIDKRPEFLMQERRALEQLRVQALARTIASKVVTPTRDEADKFIAENPSMFGQRKIYELDQIQFLRPDNIEQLGLEQTKTMEAVEAILTANKIQFRRQPSALDALGANPAFVKEVDRVITNNPQELFLFASRPQGAPAPVVLVNRVKDMRVVPFSGDKAREYATNYLKNERIQTALKSEVERQQKSLKDRVVTQKGWELPDAKAGNKPNLELPNDMSNAATGADKTATEASPAPAAATK